MRQKTGRRTEVAGRESPCVKAIGMSADVVGGVRRLTLIEIIVVPLLVHIRNADG